MTAIMMKRSRLPEAAYGDEAGFRKICLPQVPHAGRLATSPKVISKLPMAVGTLRIVSQLHLGQTLHLQIAIFRG